MILPEYFRTVYKLYPNVVSIDEGQGAFDAEGNSVEVDMSLVVSTYDANADNRAFESLRKKRNRLLKETDWVTLKAYSQGVSVPTEWATYQQELRDLPSNTTDPSNPVWPTKPA